MPEGSFTDRVRAVGLPLDQIIVIASGVMDAYGIRKADDIDLAVSAELFASLATSEKWQAHVSDWGERYFRNADCEVWAGWTEPGKTWPLYEDLMRDTVIIDDVRFMTLEYVRNWKQKKGREKDLEDIKLIDAYNKVHD